MIITTLCGVNVLVVEPSSAPALSPQRANRRFRTVFALVVVSPEWIIGVAIPTGGKWHQDEPGMKWRRI